MPIPGQKIIKPIDFSKSTAVGIAIPLYPSGNSTFKLDYISFNHVKSKLKMVLFTNGERPMRPNFGCNLKSTLFNNDLNITADQIETVIRQQVNKWVPEIIINTITAVPHPEYDNAILVTLKFSLTYDSDATDVITFSVAD